MPATERRVVLEILWVPRRIHMDIESFRRSSSEYTVLKLADPPASVEFLHAVGI